MAADFLLGRGLIALGFVLAGVAGLAMAMEAPWYLVVAPLIAGTLIGALGRGHERRRGRT